MSGRLAACLMLCFLCAARRSRRRRGKAVGNHRPGDRRLHPPRLPGFSPRHHRADDNDASALRRAVASSARQRTESFRRYGRRLVDGRDHPFRTRNGAEPAGARAVLAGSQGHRPEAGAGSACRKGPERHRCRAARRQERRHAGARRAGIRAVRHRRRRVVRPRRRLSLRLWRRDRGQSRRHRGRACNCLGRPRRICLGLGATGSPAIRSTATTRKR